MRRAALAFAFLAAAVPTLAAPTAAVADPSFECSIGSGSQVETGVCVSATEERVNATVDIAFGFAMDAASRLDAETGRAVSVAALEGGQRAWEAYRDQHCAFVGTTFGGGSGTGIAITSCRIELGRERVETLLDYAQ